LQFSCVLFDIEDLPLKCALRAPTRWVLDVIIENNEVNPIAFQESQESPDLREIDQNQEQEEAKSLFAHVEPLPLPGVREKLRLEIVA
jgi:hypothetical protein